MPPPVLPEPYWGNLLGSLDAPSLAPGSSGSISGVVADPFGAPMTAIVVSLEFYAFNAFPGNATGPVPSDAGATLVGANSTGAAVLLDLPALAPGASESFSVTALVGAGAPDGDYAIRTALAFVENGTAFRLESRGFFSAQEWANATSAPGNSTTLNASRLGVSGVVPETSVLVRSTSYTWALYAILGAGLVLAGVGGYVAWRRGPGSRSGEAGPADPHNAPRALGNNRKSDGD